MFRSRRELNNEKGYDCESCNGELRSHNRVTSGLDSASLNTLKDTELASQMFLASSRVTEVTFVAMRKSIIMPGKFIYPEDYSSIFGFSTLRLNEAVS